MSLCGYDRPTTPRLQAWVEGLGDKVAWTCQGHPPGTWTLPSHASYFTGVAPLEHSALLRSHPVPESQVTLAEEFAARGWQTAIFSANPVLSPAAGLLQGFEHVLRAPDLDAFRGKDALGKFEELLAQLDPKKPLFLVVNLIDAHDPYPRVPRGVDWVAEQDPVGLLVDPGRDGLPAVRFMDGVLPPREAKAYVQKLTDGYDWGVHEADETLIKVIRRLREGGFSSRGQRLVITSDHGEHLGEHGLVRHNGVPYDPVARVPLLVRDDTRDKQVKLDGPLSTLVVWSLLRTGDLPGPLPPVTTVSTDDRHDKPWRDAGVALWIGEHEKLVWRAGTTVRYDLAQDPQELTPLPADDHPRVGEVTALVEQLHATEERLRSQKKSRAMAKELEELGYVDE
jgi:hypothetical protein